MTRFSDLFEKPKTIIAVCHLPPLPDYPDSPGLEALRMHALADLTVLEDAGVDGLLIENEYDRPHRIAAQPETVAAMHAITRAAVAAARGTVIGCEILLNDPRASLDVCKSSGARFIRVDYFVDRMSRPGYGEFEIDADGLIEYRRRIGQTNVLILADIQVKYATMLEARQLAESARLACLHGADAVVVTGTVSGHPPSLAQLREGRAGIRASGLAVPLLIGSGLNSDNAAELLSACDGAIVGTTLMREGRIDAERLRELLSAAERAQQ